MFTLANIDAYTFRKGMLYRNVLLACYKCIVTTHLCSCNMGCILRVSDYYIVMVYYVHDSNIQRKGTHPYVNIPVTVYT